MGWSLPDAGSSDEAVTASALKARAQAEHGGSSDAPSRRDRCAGAGLGVLGTVSDLRSCRSAHGQRAQ